MEQDVENVTQFFVVGKDPVISDESTKTSIVFTLPNTPGVLLDFLLPFKNEDVNLTRILSRPIVGKPETYVFLVDVAGTQKQPNVKAALSKASHIATSIRTVGSYPVRKAYDS